MNEKQVCVLLDDSFESLLLPSKINEKSIPFINSLPIIPSTVEKIVIIGDFKVGKTRLVFRLSRNKYLTPYTKFNDPMHSVLKTIYYRHDYITGILFDTELLTPFGNNSPYIYKGAKAIIVCYDISNRKTFENVHKWIENVYNTIGNNNSFDLILVATKADNIYERKVSFNEGLELANQYGMKLFYETSSKTGQNIDEMFYRVLQLVRDRVLLESDKDKDITMERNVIENQSNDGGSWCLIC
ncbi:hypothetical protein ABK040_002646 [Willaertia magna]